MTETVVVSVLIPAWDEEEAIGRVVTSALEALNSAGITAEEGAGSEVADDDAVGRPRSSGITVECLVSVDARTTDRTSEVARGAGARTLLQQSRGLTAAVLELADVARGDVCVVLDGDGQHDARKSALLVVPLLAGEADLVTGARDSESLRAGFGSGWRGRLRHAGGRLMALAARRALRADAPDPLTGMFACRRGDLVALRKSKAIAPPSGYKLLLGLLVATPRNRVTHVPVPFLPRTAGGSKLGARIALTVLAQLARIILHRLHPSHP